MAENDRREVAGAPLWSPASRQREQIRVRASRRAAAGVVVGMPDHEKLSETEARYGKGACRVGADSLAWWGASTGTPGTGVAALSTGLSLRNASRICQLFR